MLLYILLLFYFLVLEGHLYTSQLASIQSKTVVIYLPLSYLRKLESFARIFQSPILFYFLANITVNFGPKSQLLIFTLYVSSLSNCFFTLTFCFVEYLE